MSATDTRRRADALDPAASFIVEAPAGSGKTELLTQRYLKLLGRVDLPEQIVAITFTRKAAAEMRQRVIETLRAATLQAPSLPAHRRDSLALARHVLARAEDRGWSLLEQSQRLRILTIDALNTSLARQLPILTSAIVSIEVTDDAEGLYRRAARQTAGNLAAGDRLGEALRQLLQGTDNSLSALEARLAATLPQRDRWLRLFQEAGGRPLADAIESGLGRLREAQLAELRALAGAAREARLIALLRARDRGQPGEPMAVWRQAAASLLTAAGQWRQRFTRKEGFPPDAADLRRALQALLEDFRATEGLRERLAALGRLPDCRLSPTQRETLDALAPVLERLLAELRIAFAESGSVDHTELALAALEALGAVDAPSDLLLALDRRIEHILVDEFQDTSHLQWALLERLTAGWTPGDGRSLFLVGDPMQSIYRFRDADLTLFQRARERGLGDIRLRPIELGVNHRSAAELVDWVNGVFTRVFPGANGEDASSPRFRPAIAGRGSVPGAGVELHVDPVAGPSEEIARVVSIVDRELRDHGAESIGILVRSRSHLLGMRAALAEAGLAAHAVEIDSLTDTAPGQDLLALTMALVHEGDRLAWLAVLHGPCGGIGWEDLHALCAHDRKRTIRALLSDRECLGRLTPEGRRRADWLRERLETGLRRRATQSLGDWVRDCWRLIDGPAALSGASDVRLAERYFGDLDRFARDGDIDDPAQLAAWFARPSGAETPSGSGIEIMTIHRAKGLEFDTVVLPGLSRTTRGKDDNLLLCKDIDLPDEQRISLAAGRALGEPLYAWLSAIERDHEAAERARLLYVAATRARRRLYLIGALDGRAENPRSGSLLATLWPGIDAGVAALPKGSGGKPDAPAAADAPGFIELPLRRLRLDGEIPAPALAGPQPAETGAPRPEFEWVQPASVQVGTLIHRELHRLALGAARTGAPVAPEPDTARYRRELALLGVEAADLAAAAGRVAEALERVWADPVGRWILKPWREAWSELRMTIRGPERLEHIRLDRSFVDEAGRRWIVDYKTGRHLGADVEQFLSAEVERYRDQLEHYARAVAATESRPIRVGLYFPLMSCLRDWTPAAGRASSE